MSEKAIPEEFVIIERAGLTQGEFAELIGVSRNTVNLWMNGPRRPHFLLRRRVDKALELLKKAVDDARLPGAMPPPRPGHTEERAQYIRSALQ